jgi:hypothetical protein
VVLLGNYAQIGAHTMNESLLLLNDDLWNVIFDFGSNFVPGTDLVRSFLYAAHGPGWNDMALRASEKEWSLWNMGLGIIPWVALVLPYALIQLIPLIATFHGKKSVPGKETQADHIWSICSHDLLLNCVAPVL